MRNADNLAIHLAEATLEGTDAVSRAPARVVGFASAGEDKGEQAHRNLRNLDLSAAERGELTSLGAWRSKA
jgi:hypothetical protein